MKVFVTGVSGQLGCDCMNELAKRGVQCIGTDLSDTNDRFDNYVGLDITDRDKVIQTITDINPDVVIHCAAWTAVDLAEDENNKPKVLKINAEGTKNIADACKMIDSKMVYISTDYVFNGQGETPWDADCKDFAPLNYYGFSKLEGEKAVSNTLDKFFVIRIAWVFGINGNNFIKTMLKLSETHDTLKVVCDQIGTPTYTYDLSKLICDMIDTDKYGFYHATNEGGYISWCDFAKEIFKIAGKNVEVIPVTTKEYGESIAKRPYNSRLDKSKLIQNGFTPLPTWNDAVERYIGELNEKV